jgi:hypothetical protein
MVMWTHLELGYVRGVDLGRRRQPQARLGALLGGFGNNTHASLDNFADGTVGLRPSALQISIYSPRMA